MSLEKNEVLFPTNVRFDLINTITLSREDRAELARCLNSFRDSDSWPGGFDGTFENTAESVKDWLERVDLSTFFIIRAPDNPKRIAGLCVCNRSWSIENAWYVDLLGVDPAYQGKKLGKALLLKATKLALEKNARLISLHTWGGNLKALPLYKKQGYKWRPKTSVFMENYIPQILAFPLFKKFFSRHCWYDVFRPKITQSPDEEFEDNMAIYVYEFESSSGEKLTVWIDRTIGRMSGFRILSEELKLQVKARTPSSRAWIGFESFPVELILENLGNEEIHVTITMDKSKEIIIEKDLDEHEIRLAPREKKVLSINAKLDSRASEVNISENPALYTKVFFTFKGIINNETFELSVGKDPVKGLDVLTEPEHLLIKNNTTNEINLRLINQMTEELEVTLTLEDGHHVKFNNHSKNFKLSKFDDTIKFIAKTTAPDTMVDHVKVIIKSRENDKILLEKNLPIMIHVTDKPVHYEIDDKIIVRNKDIIVEVERFYWKMSNEIRSQFVGKPIKIGGGAIILGMPFDVEGSEFYTKNLMHQVTSIGQEICLRSTGISRIKKDIKITREIIIPPTGPRFGIRFVLENTSNSRQENLGVYQGIWYDVSSGTHQRIVPFSDGVVATNLTEIKPHVKRDPNLLSEGWIAVALDDFCTGMVFDKEKISQVDVLTSRRALSVQTTLGDLSPGETWTSPVCWFLIERSWKDVRKTWFELFKSPSEITFLENPIPKDVIKIGLTRDKTNRISRAMIIENKTNKFFVSIDTLGEAKIPGEVSIEMEDVEIEPNKFSTSDINQHHHFPVKIKRFKKKRQIYPGYIRLRPLSRIHEFPIALVPVDQNKDGVKIHEQETRHGIIHEINNGYLSFKASADFAGRVFSLRPLDEPASRNYLLTFHPEVKPFEWFEEFHGGIYSFIRNAFEWDDITYRKLKFSIEWTNMNHWKGVVIKSPVITESKTLKGLQCNSWYLTLPGVPLVYYKTEIFNMSRSTREFAAECEIHLDSSRTEDDLFVLPINSVDTKIWRRDIRQSFGLNVRDAWIAYKMKDWKHFMGIIPLSITPGQKFQLNIQDLKWSVVTLYKDPVKLQPGGKISLEMLISIADSLQEIKSLKHFKP